MWSEGSGTERFMVSAAKRKGGADGQDGLSG